MVYINTETGEFYYGGAMTRMLDNSTLWSGIPTSEQLTEWGFVEYIPPEPPEPQPPTPDDELDAYEALQIITEGGQQ